MVREYCSGMPRLRLRLGVVLLVPEPWAIEINGLRRACGDQQLERVPPHVTLVPPINVRVEDVPAALTVLRAAAATRPGPLVVRLGPPASFHPDTDTLHLAVGADEGERAEVRTLRDAVFVAPLERTLEWPFVPHVTLSDVADQARSSAALDALADYLVEVPFDRLHLLEEQRSRHGRRIWVPVADAPFESPAIVGRGGIELELCRSELVDPEATAFEQREYGMLDVSSPPPRLPAGATPMVFCARRRGELVGVARGWSREGEREIGSLLVAAGHRGLGIARQLRLAFAGARVPDDGSDGRVV